MILQSTETINIIFEANYTTDVRTHLYIDPERISEKVWINGKEAEYYPSDGSSNTNNLIWYDEEYEVMFNIYSNLDRDSIIRIAENIEIEIN